MLLLRPAPTPDQQLFPANGQMFARCIPLRTIPPFEPRDNRLLCFLRARDLAPIVGDTVWLSPADSNRIKSESSREPTTHSALEKVLPLPLASTSIRPHHNQGSRYRQSSWMSHIEYPA